MGFSAGQTLGPYEVLALVGQGGMGEVWKARDQRLDRIVAIKTSAASFTERFEREARAVAALNHPHICHLYDVGPNYLVMEYIDGTPLKGPLPVATALQYGSELLDALACAHGHGIVHRDLKPANVLVTKSGIKLLDFGLAKIVGLAAASEAITSEQTDDHTILGTLGYMAPEQLQGKPADARTDIFTFGCVLYEMLTGRRAFVADSRASLIALILKEDVPPPSTVALGAKPPIPQALDAVVSACMSKDPDDRWQTARDLRRELIRIGQDSAAAVGGARASGRRVAPVALAALAGGALITLIATLFTWALTRPAPQAPVLPMRFAIVPPLAHPLGLPRVQRDLALSPDGRHLVYRSTFGTGGGQLAVRDIEQVEARLMDGITNARDPFFSADSRWIGFFDGDELKKVLITGGPAITVCQTDEQGVSAGASWDEDDTIVFATRDVTSGLWRVPATGDGKPTVLTTPDPAQHEGDHLYPSMLPGGRGVLFTITAGGPGTEQVAVLDLKSGERNTLIRGGSAAQYVDVSTASTHAGLGNSRPRGYLVYASAGALRTVGFDLTKLQVLGESVPVVEDVLVNGPGAANYGVSRSGTLVYIPGATEPQRTPRSLVWVDRKGHEEPIKAPLRGYGAPRLAPDGTRVAVDIKDRQADIWIWDLARETLTRLTLDSASFPVWTADGRRVAFSSWRMGDAQNLFARAADGAGAIDQLTTSTLSQVPSSVTPDGTYVVGWEFAQKTARDITLVALANPASRPETGPSSDTTSSQVEPLIQTSFNELNGEISPDGRYLAYQSDESGRYEVYVRPFPQVNVARWQVSTGGGTQPAWARSGQELFYLDDADLLTAVPVRTSGGAFSAGKPIRILDTKYGSPEVRRTYDVSPDGQRFLMPKENGDPNSTPARMIVVLNWFEELKARVSTK